jgi:hypothetical protein
MNRHTSLRGLIRGALAGCLCAAAAGQQSPPQYSLRVDGAPVVSTRPVTRVAGEWFVPLAALGRALGASLSLYPAAQSLRVLRDSGVTATYDGPTGRILQGSVLAGEVAGFRQVQLNTGMENVMFPLSGAIALFGVTAREDTEQQTLEIDSTASTVGAGAGNGPLFQFASLEQRYGLTTNGHIWQQFLNIHGDGMVGGNRLTGNLDLTQTAGSSFPVFRQGSLRLDMANQRSITVGDQGTNTGVEALMNSVRGIGYGWGWRGFLVDEYGGLAASSTSAGLGTSGSAIYDTFLTGFGARRKVGSSDFSLAGNEFRGPNRGGATLGAAYNGNYARNEFKLQGLLGYFSGVSLSPVLQSVNTIPGTQAVATVAPGIVEVEQETQHVRGPGYGFSLLDSYTPLKSNLLIFTGLWENYSRNFLVARDESRFSAVSRRSFSSSLRPSRYISFTGTIRSDAELLGSAGTQLGYTYGVYASTPGHVPIQGGYFRSVQSNGGASGTRFELSQYSLQIPNWKRFGASATYSETLFGNLGAKSVAETFSADFKRFGRLSLHDQLQFGSGSSYGLDWSRPFGHSGSYILAGLERQTSPARGAILAPMAALRVPLFRRQTLTMSYLSTGGSSTLRFEIGGPLLAKREQVTANSRTALVVLASLTGQVYFDADLDGSFKAGVDRPLPQMQVLLDGEIATTTDASGYFHFDGLTPGSHRLRARIATLPANLIFAQEELNVAVMPYRSNRQDFRAIRTGKIQGTVTIATLDDAGRETVKPYPDVRIIAIGNRDTFSESDGAFVLGDLPPGTYQLRIDPGTVPGDFIGHPATQTVEVKSGKSSSGVEFRLSRPVIVRSAPPLSRGVVEGMVWETRADGRSPAPGVTVRLDRGRTVASGSDGRFRFADVPAGGHRVAIVNEQLPAEFEPGPTTEAAVTVTPGKAATVELAVILMATLRGRVSGPAGLALNGIVILLSGTERHITADAEGNFGFSGLHDGDHTVLLDESTLPENAVLTTPGNVTLSLRAGQEAPLADFHLEIRRDGKPGRTRRATAPGEDK